MILISPSSRGVKRAPKQQALKRLIAVYNPDVLFIKKSMCVGSKAVEILSSFWKDWDFCSVDSEGLSEGLVTAWNKKFDIISTEVISSGIVIDVISKELGRIYNLINLYGSYGERKSF